MFAGPSYLLDLYFKIYVAIWFDFCIILKLIDHFSISVIYIGDIGCVFTSGGGQGGAGGRGWGMRRQAHKKCSYQQS